MRLTLCLHCRDLGSSLQVDTYWSYTGWSSADVRLWLHIAHESKQHEIFLMARLHGAGLQPHLYKYCTDCECAEATSYTIILVWLSNSDDHVAHMSDKCMSTSMDTHLCTSTRRIDTSHVSVWCLVPNLQCKLCHQHLTLTCIAFTAHYIWCILQSRRWHECLALRSRAFATWMTPESTVQNCTLPDEVRVNVANLCTTVCFFINKDDKRCWAMSICAVSGTTWVAWLLPMHFYSKCRRLCMSSCHNCKCITS